MHAKFVENSSFRLDLIVQQDIVGSDNYFSVSIEPNLLSIDLGQWVRQIGRWNDQMA